MIAYIKGTVTQVTEQAIVVENQGMGYLIYVSGATLSRLPRAGEEIQLHTYLQVKEDGLALFGFLSQEELNIFKLLISVSGIGPKVATAMLSVLQPAQIMVAILTDDSAALSKAPGVGKKLAQRLALELRDKIKTGDALLEMSAGVAVPGGAGMEFGEKGDKQDAIDALLALGYGRSEAVKVVLEVALPEMKAEQIIKLALRKLAR